MRSRVFSTVSGSVAVAVLSGLMMLATPSVGHARTANSSLTLTGLTTPTGVAIAPNGDRYVTDQGNMNSGGTVPSQVFVYDPGSTTPNPAKTISGFNQTQGIAIGPTGEVFVADASVVKVFSAGSSTLARTITGFNLATGLAFDSSGRLYVTDLFDGSFGPGNQVYVVEPGASSPNPSLTLTGVRGPGGIAVDGVGRVRVSNLGQLDFMTGAFDGTTVSVFDPGQTTPNPTKTLTGFTAPSGVAVGMNSDVYVGNLGFNAGGTTVTVFNGGSQTPNPGKTLTGLRTPALMAFDSTGYLYVANNQGQTVSVFDPLVQLPAGGCVTPGVTTSIPRAGTKQLMKSNCVTNSGQRVGVRVDSAKPRGTSQRGDVAYYRLFCQVTKTKTAKTVSAGYGGGYRICKKGALKIRTFGTRLSLKITWYAPANRGYAAYKLTRTYRT